MNIATAFIEIRPDTRRGAAETKEAVREMATEATKTLAQFFSAAVVVNELRKVVGAASRLEQAVGGSAAVFGRFQRDIDQAARTSARAMGLSEAAFRELSSQIGGLLQGLGFTQQEAAKTSIKLAQMGADLAATFGGRPEEAVQALGAALRGEFDPLERFGISLNVTQANLKAVELGLASSTSKVDLNARAQAALAIITERGALAAGQYGREQDTAAGRVSTATAELENMRAKLGQELLPMFVTAVGLLSGLASAFSDLPGPIQVALVALVGVAALAGPLTTMVGAVKALGAALVTANPYFLAAGVAAAALMGVITLLTRRHETLNDRLKETAERVEDVRTEMQQFGSTSEYLLSKFTEVAAENETMRRGLERSGVTLAELAEAGAASTEEFNHLRTQMLRGAIAAGATEEEVAALRSILGDLRYESREAAKVQGQLAEVTDDVEASTDEARTALEEYAEAQAAARDEILKTLGVLFDYEKATLALDDAYDRFRDAQLENLAVQSDATASTQAKAESSRRLREAELGVADSALQAAQAFAREQGAVDGSLRSAQLQVGKLVELAAKYPELRDEIGQYISRLGEIPGAVPTDIKAMIDQGDYDAAERALNQLARNRQAFVNVSTVTGGQIVRSGMPNVRSAQGRYVDRFMVSSLGEEGPEAVLPLTKPSRLAQLLTDDRIRRPVVDALGGAPGGGGGNTINVGAINTMQPRGVRDELEALLWRAGT